MAVPNTCGHVTGEFKIFELLFGPNQRLKSQRLTKNVLFWYFFNSPEPQPDSITTKIDNEVEHHNFNLNALTNFCYGTYYFFQEVGNFKNDQN